ncbi:MAG TPA: enolase C-terminal domain-like protein [Candidatus Sulfotelmatobacter sp.]|jgi:o-succinylbenzoate synthase|nr:enolase C-terminal domain-like protein [Candidatus Sulfotelmatobacter sp.]
MSARIASVQVKPYCLGLRRPWPMVGHCQPCRDGWLVSVADDQGRTGWGDACNLPGRPAPSPDLLRRAGQLLVGRSVDGALASISLAPAFEAALLDLSSQAAGLSLCRLLSAAASDRVKVNALVEDEASLAEALADGFGVIKLKVGLRPVEAELERLRALALPSGVRLRLDANRAWSREQAVQFIAGVTGLPIDGLEEPLAEPDLVAYGQLQGYCPFPLALDESLCQLDWIRLLENPPVRRLVIKPSQLGGLRRSLDLIGEASERGLECVITSIVDSAVGVAAAAHLAAASGFEHLAHGLATGAWLGSDVAKPLPMAQGVMSLPDLPGLGVIPR